MQGVELALLGLLQRQQPTYAYELHQALQQTEALGLVWRLKQSNLYALLAKLEAASYIASSLEPHGTRPPRKLLQLTTAGRERLGVWLETPVTHGREIRLEFLAKLFFAAEKGEQAVATLIQRQRAACRVWIGELEREGRVVAPERRFEQLVLQFRRSQLEAILSWLETCDQTLTQPVQPTP